MEFELIDGYLLDGAPSKSEVVRKLLQTRPQTEGARPFYEGMQRLGARTPDLALIALRLILAGRKADDAAVTWLRDVAARARAGDGAARDEYRSVDRPAQ
jgi:Arc/MetJ-type ribon-helix-helix transcriptional regulator